MAMGSRATEYWTTVLDSSETEKKDSAKSILNDFKRVPRFENHVVQLLQKIGEGGQGEIYRARVYVRNNHLNEDEQLPVDCVVKEFKDGAYGQWPEAIFELSKLFPYICGFLGYYREKVAKIEKVEESDEDFVFYLVMHEYEYSLRGVIDKEMRRRKDGRALFMMVHIALGMRILQENPTWRSPKEGSDVVKKKSLVHRGLKADNVFVRCEASGRFPIAAYIGDFDVGSKVAGTKFWRATEILQAAKDGISLEKIEFGPEADVYSYAMTCYEILTGGIPLQELMHSDYDVVISGKRPKLPSNLNPKVRALIERCWHSDPAMRPTFVAIVAELEELIKELVTGSQDMSKTFATMFERVKTSLDIVSAGAESNLVTLKELLQELVVKYNQADFLLLGLELVAAMEEFKSEYGFESFQKQLGLPYSQWFARRKLFDTILWKKGTFALKAAYIVELGKLSALMENIVDTISKDNCLEDELAKLNTLMENTSKENCLKDSFSTTDDKNVAETKQRQKEVGAYLQEVQKRMQNAPSSQHKKCVDKLTGRASQGEEFQACGLCKFEPSAGDEGNVKYRLYVGNGESPFTKLATSLGVKIGRWKKE